MIWIGITLAVVGGLIFYRTQDFSGIPLLQAFIALALLLNGYFLSFQVSPYLLKREQEGKSGELLPATWQKKILVSLVISDLGWWVGLLLLVIYLVKA